MNECREELHTQHYLGRWHGFGPVRNREHVIFAVFEKTKRDGSQLTAMSFDSTQLAKDSESLVRALYVTRSIFDSEVAEGGSLQKGTLVGISCADVSRIRKLRTDIRTSSGSVNVRSLCILDKVEEGDYDGHATTGYGEGTAPQGIGQTYLGKVRLTIRLDLANEFSNIENPDDSKWPAQFGIPLKRFGSIMRVLRDTLLG